MRQTADRRRDVQRHDGRRKMTTNTRKKSRLRLVLIAAAALGSSSATLSGVLGTLAIQQQSGSQATFA
jgi:hypothetical protein